MLNLLINFCIITFVCYAASGPVKAILFPKKRRVQKRVAAKPIARAQQRRKAKIIVISRKRAVRSNMRAA